MDTPEETGRRRLSNFITDLIDADRAAGAYGGRVVTRFPPEPNGYLHIGHAKSICLNFGLALDYGGECNLRFDDTNPTTEDVEYVESIARDVAWLGFRWSGEIRYASEYFERMYAYAEQLVLAGKAYVDSQDQESIRKNRGSLHEPGVESPYRDRSVEENLDLLRRMRAGEFPDGAHVLRAKIDMASPNMLMRDPLLYRIRHAHHYRTGDRWCIYPMYDYAHCLEDAIEGVTHSICTLEFENNRELYDWILAQLDFAEPPKQIEFARLALGYTITSKRKLLQLVREKRVAGWDDPRMPTVAGFRRRGVRPEAIRTFCELVGVAKANSLVDIGKLEYCIRDDLNHEAPRVMAVLRPLKVVLTNYPEGETETFDATYWPHDVPKEGTRPVPFGRELYIERDDFREDPPKQWHRLAPGREVRLRYAYIIRCDEVVRDAAGEVTELRCTYDPATRGGLAPEGKSIRGTLHWVSAAHALPAEVRLYDRLFDVEKPDADPDVDPLTHLNPESLVTLADARVEPSLGAAAAGTHWQFERQGYFFSDPVDHGEGRLVFNRVVTLRDSWAKIAAREAGAAPAPSASAPRRKKETSAPAADARPTAARTSERDAARAQSPELAARFARYTAELGLSRDDADLLTGNVELARFYEEALTAFDRPVPVARWVVNEVLREVKDRPVTALPFSGRALGSLVALVDEGTISGPTGKELFAEMVARGGDPRQMVAERGLRQVSDEAELVPVVDRVLVEHADAADRYRNGQAQLFGWFIGQVMQATGGQADPKRVRALLQERLKA